MADITTEVGNLLVKNSANLVQAGIDTLMVAAIFAILFLIGVFVSGLVNNIIKKALTVGNFDNWLKRNSLQNALLGVSPLKIITTMVTLFTFVVAFGIAADLASSQIADIGFLVGVMGGLLAYLVSLTEGLIIVIVALYAGTYIGNTIKKAQGMIFANQLAIGLQILIGYIALILALDRLLPGIDSSIFEEILLWVVGAIILAFALGVGLALGLGLKDSISKAASKNQEAFDKLIGKIGK